MLLHSRLDQGHFKSKFNLPLSSFLCLLLQQKGDLVNIIAKNDSGTWVGMTNGKIGHFKFINVEEINNLNQSTNNSVITANQEGPLVHYYENIVTNLLTNVNNYFENSLKLLFKLIGLDKYGYFNLLQEKGFQSLNSLININNQSNRFPRAIEPSASKSILFFSKSGDLALFCATQCVFKKVKFKNKPRII